MSAPKPHGLNEKAVRLVDYVLELANLRTRLTRDIENYPKKVWFSSVPHERGCFTQAWGRDEEDKSDIWLEVQNRPEPELPAIPAECKDWINPEALRNKNDFPELLSQIIRQMPNPDRREGSDQPESISGTERLEEHPDVEQAWDRYVEDQWLPWTEEHNAWEKVHKVYAELFAIHQEQVRQGEEYELVLGLGLLTWQTPTKQLVRRHLVVADAILEFDARLSKFTVRTHTEGANLRLELDMLDIEEPLADAKKTAKKDLAAAEDDPWKRDCVGRALQSLVHSINSQGEYHDSLAAEIAASEKPIVEYAPALILRKRSAKGLIGTLKRIKKLIEDGEAVLGGFADLAEIRPKDDRERSNEPEEANAAFDGEVFFPKPSNDEQRRIVDKIQAATIVLVQGPPGTGKSHTIANLICHLLATGQRTLITAKTPRALQVLEKLVPDELRPLCINLLGSGPEERHSLESSVGAILGKDEEWNERHSQQEREELEKRLGKLREEKAEVNRRLRDIRESETRKQSIAEGAYRGTAARIAQAVERDRSEYEWFTDSVAEDQRCEISTNDLLSVIESLRQFTPEKRQELDLQWPEELPSPEHFSILVRDEKHAAEQEQRAAHGVDERLADLLARNDPADIKAIFNAFSNFRDTQSRLRATRHSWMNEALRDILCGNTWFWNNLMHLTSAVIAEVEPGVAAADEIRVEFADTIDIKMLYDDTRKLQEHMERGGKLGWCRWFRPKPVRERFYVVKDVRINGRSCSTVEDFSNLADALHIRIEIEKGWRLWKELSEKVEGPYTRQLAALKSMCEELRNALELEELMSKCSEALKACPGMDDPVWANESQVDKIIASCSLALSRISKRNATEEISSIETRILRMAALGGTHPLTKDLLGAIRERDRDKFFLCVSKIQDLDNQRARLRQVDEYLSSWRPLIPQLIRSLEQTCNEPYWEERAKRFDKAWHWAQARYWIEEHIRREDVQALAIRAKQIEGEINSTVAKLAALRAWSFYFSRLREDHRRNMLAWQSSMRKLGKGTGKYAPRYRREAQEHLNKCRESVPAWVMPLHRVWDTVDPTPGMFDVIIVDEASQCGFEALPLFYLGKKILIVGDDKQISPDAVGLLRESVHRQMDTFLYDFQFKSSFDVESSLFDHGKLRCGTSRITLREHFRCMPEIIRFSNDLCYSDTPLIPLRQYGPNRLPPIDHVFVPKGYREGSESNVINRPEAEAIVERIVEMCKDKSYDDKTMGVVVLQGEAQADYIDRLLLERLGDEERERRRLVCGNPYSFQGDERDIMFLSLVAATNERIGPLTKPADERRFNVAASRAKDQMILFHSVNCDDLSKHDLRWRLLDFFENPRTQSVAGMKLEELERRAAQDNRNRVKAPEPFESWFEVDVALEILRENYTVIPQYEVAGKRIDLVVDGGQARLAIECDGDYWHGADRYEEDMQRQRQLERCGWEFFRIRESSFYANKRDALKPLWSMLKDRGILPVGACPN